MGPAISSPSVATYSRINQNERKLGMGFIKWNDNLSVKVSEVDNQHKKLIGLVNQLYDAMRVVKEREVLGSVLTELVNYTLYHFSTAERLFREYDYPEYDKHKQIHDDLTRKTKELKESFDQGNKMITIDVMLFLSNRSGHLVLKDCNPARKRSLEYDHNRDSPELGSGATGIANE